MKKYYAFICCMIIFLLVGCNGNQGDTTELQDVEDGVDQSVDDGVTELVVDSDGADEIEEEATYVVSRQDTLSGGHKMVSLETEYDLDQFEYTNDSEGDYIVIIALDGLERSKTYQLNLAYLNDSASQVYLLNEDETIIYETWELGNGLGELAQDFVFEADIDYAPKLKIISQSALTVTEFSIKRLVGELKFEDNFDYTGLPDPEVWGYEVGGHGWGNAELQFYTDGNPKNVNVDNGELVITALYEEVNNNDYSSTRMRTLESFTYGRIEFNAKLPYGVGTWPALWMLPTTDRFGGWPNSGEIDIMEHVGYDMDVVHGSIHTGAFNFRLNNHTTGEMHIPMVDTEFHVYAIEWTPYYIDFYIDDYLYVTYVNDGGDFSHWPFDDNFYILMNIAVGGGWGGQQGVDDSAFPAEMVIDYVRIYDINDKVMDTQPPTTPTNLATEIENSIVKITWDMSEDDYLVDYYNIYVDGQLIESIDDTDYTIYNLQGNENYDIAVEAVDIVGNTSEMAIVMAETGNVEYVLLPSLIEVDQIYYNHAGEIAFTDDNISYLNYLDDGDQLIYALEVEQSGYYFLELDYQAKIFEGAIVFETISGEELASLTLETTGSSGDWGHIESEAFYLESGELLYVMDIVAGSFKLDKIGINIVE